MIELDQKEIFLQSQGDSYFFRNKEKLEIQGNERQDVDVIAKYIKPGQKVLEIGCSNGRILQYLKGKIGCDCFGIDPSNEAIISGNKNSPGLNLKVGTADKLEYADGFFDFVLFGFCLYLVDRKFLTRTVAEADRVLKPGGFLGIIDFDVKTPRRRAWKHYDGVFSYKDDYTSMFTAFPQYTLIERRSYSHTSPEFTTDIEERLAVCVIYKELNVENLSAIFSQEETKSD